jgi:hypothetical protein
MYIKNVPIDSIRNAVKKTSSIKGTLELLGCTTHGSQRKRLNDIVSNNDIDISHFTSKKYIGADFSKQHLEPIVRFSSTYKEVIEKLGFNPENMCTDTIKKHIENHSLSTEHFYVGKVWWSPDNKELMHIINTSHNYAECALRLGIERRSLRSLHSFLDKNAIDTSHFTYSRKTDYSKKNIEAVAAVSNTYTDCLALLNLSNTGTNRERLKSKIKKYNIDISHFDYQSRNQGGLESSYKGLVNGQSIRTKLIQERGRKCEDCSLEKWRDKNIPLQMHHEDKNPRNNSGDNLFLLCPNCHMQRHNRAMDVK